MEKNTGLEIAIIGMAGRFPGANTIEVFWDNLRKGVESIDFFSREELLREGEDASVLDNSLYVNAISYVKGKENFDAAFFDYLPSEAQLMDPQMRLFHEVCWHALEDAGCNPKDPASKIGLFAGGASNVSWLTYSIIANREGLTDDYTAMHLRDINFLCSHISYLFDFQGPAVTLHTACSTSLVAVQRACMSLLLRECNMALAGGVFISSKPRLGYVYRDGMINSADGHCRTFDAQASGTIVGDGAGTVVLKRLEDALKDGDNIYAVIKGSAVNNDGYQKVGFTAPSIDGQSKAIMKAIQMARVDPSTISYVEAHGTGTRLGDPVEIAGLTRAFNTSKKQFCAVGSVKTNIGHLDTAAGIAGLIKTVLALKHKQLPPSLHFTAANPEIDFVNSPFYVNAELCEWKAEGHPLRAGVSSFGIGGTNAHVVLEEAPARQAGTASRSYQMLMLSGKTPGALERNAVNLLNYLKEQKPESLANIAYTLQKGRESFSYRKMLVCNSPEQAITLLGSAALDSRGYVSGKRTPQVVFMFSGQGSQYVNMCRGLYDEEPGFKAILDRCFNLVSQKYNKDLRSVLFSDRQDGSDGLSDIDLTAYTQPCLFITEYAIAQLLISWGITPAIMIGHSIGEYTAACISGVFTLEEALHLVVKRGELMQSAPAGRMLSVSLPEHQLLPLIENNAQLSLAAVNSSGSCVVSGDASAIDTFRVILESQGHISRLLRTSHAFHSYMMDEVLEGFREVFGSINLKPAQIPFISNITGKKVLDEEVMSVDYWVSHLRGTISFNEGMETLLESKQLVLMEAGPGKVLASLAESNKKKEQSHVVLNTVRASREQGSDLYHLLCCIGKLWEQGVSVNWDAYYGSERRLKVSLPGYSFEPVPYPVHVDPYKLIKESMGTVAVNAGRDISTWFYVQSWKKSLLPATKRNKAAGRRTLLLTDNNGIGAALASGWDEAEEIIMVEQGEGFYQKSAGCYLIHPQRQEDYTLLAAHLSKNGKLPDRIIHMWSVSEDDGIDAAAETRKMQLARYFYSLALIVNAFNVQSVHMCKQVVLVTNEAQLIRGEETADPIKLMAEGLLKVIGQEYPWVSASHIDISLAELKEGNKESLVDSLRIEISRACRGEVVAVRNGQRWLEMYDKINLEEPAAGSSFKQGGVYVISGGLGNLGYNLSKYLLSRYNARLVLLGRTALEDHAGSVKKDRKEALSAMGGDVIYIRCDISSKADLTKALCEAGQRFGDINGVIHAAGIVEGESVSLIRELDESDFTCQFEPKVTGLEVLAEALQDKSLDFCLLTSSLSSVLGGLGFGAYASANVYMDQFVRRGTSKKLLKNWVSVNLDGLDFDKQVNDKDITVPELCEVLERVLGNKEIGHIIVSKTDLYQRLDQWINSAIDPGKDGEPASIQMAEGEQAQVEVICSLPQVTDRLKEIWQVFFGKAQIEDSADFFELGGDSLKALTMLSRIYKAFNVDLSIKDFYSSSGLASQAGLIFRKKVESEQQGEKNLYTSIPVVQTGTHFKLSAAQRRLYFLYELDRQSLAYNMPKVMWLQGIVDVERVRWCFENLILRHEILRTGFEIIDGHVLQKVEQEYNFIIEEYQSQEAGIDEIIARFIKPFNLNHAPLLRVGLIRVSSGLHILLFDMHHIVTDGVSANLMVRDFMSLYNGEQLAPLRLQYKDYAQWQQSAPEQERILMQKDFWMQQYAELPEALNLPFDYSRPVIKSMEGAMLKRTLPAGLTTILRALAEKQGVSMFMVLLSIYHVLLSKLSGQEDIVVGTSTAGRSHADLEEVMGMFVNTLPLRNRSRNDMTFREFLAEVKLRSLACFDHQSYQYEDMIEALGIKRDMSRNPLFDVMFSYENFAIADLELDDLKSGFYETKHTVSKFDITLTAREEADDMHINFEYCTALFKQETMERIAAYFDRIAQTVAANVEITIKDITIIDEAERTKLLHGFNDTVAPYPSDKTIIDLFEEQADRTPQAIALRFGNSSMNYSELNDISDRIALYLREVHGVGTGDLVGIMVEREYYLIALLYGIMKAGAAYVPIDPGYPESRVASIVTDSKLKVLLKRGSSGDPGIKDHTTIVDLNEVFTGMKEYARKPLPVKPKAGDLSYVIYTSGSTGHPKGVMIEHGSLVNRLWWMQKSYPLTGKDVILQKTPIVFDVSLWELFWWSFTGASVCVLLPGEEKDPQAIKAAIQNNNVTTLHFVPSMLDVFLLSLSPSEIPSRLKSLHKVFCSGEALKVEQVEKFTEALYKHKKVDLINLYGPTEATVDVSYYNCALSETLPRCIPIGKPIDNTSLYLLDKNLGLSATGVTGELYIGGIGVARGYLNNEALTRETFIENPFKPGERMYRTGDLARWLEDGNIEYTGRIDDQVKIRGLRIELGEIAYQLSVHEQVRQCTVLVRERSGNKYLIAYYVSDSLITAIELRDFLSKRLPDYMIPAFFVRMETFPLTVNGKLDKKAFPDPEIEVQDEYVPPSTAIEEKLVEIWSCILQLDQEIISVENNFFDLGGNSLLATTLVNRIRTNFELEFALKEIFESPTIRQQASLIEIYILMKDGNQLNNSEKVEIFI